jgi:hypothetical protein
MIIEIKMNLNNNKTWEQLWVEFKKNTGTENTYLFYKWIEEQKITPIK